MIYLNFIVDSCSKTNTRKYVSVSAAAAANNRTVSDGPFTDLGLYRPCNPVDRYVWIWCCLGSSPGWRKRPCICLFS